MYRLTVTGTANVAFLSQHAHTKPIRQRVYRWENKWGYLRKEQMWDDSWLAEERTFVSAASTDENVFLLETYTPLQSLPPVDIDDVWDEEVICDKNITCNSLLSITGSKQELINFCKTHSIQVPSKIVDSIVNAT